MTVLPLFDLYRTPSLNFSLTPWTTLAKLTTFNHQFNHFRALHQYLLSNITNFYSRLSWNIVRVLESKFENIYDEQVIYLSVCFQNDFFLWPSYGNAKCIFHARQRRCWSPTHILLMMSSSFLSLIIATSINKNIIRPVKYRNMY